MHDGEAFFRRPAPLPNGEKCAMIPPLPVEVYRSGHNGTDSKSVEGQLSVGSNPTASANKPGCPQGIPVAFLEAGDSKGAAAQAAKTVQWTVFSTPGWRCCATGRIPPPPPTSRDVCRTSRLIFLRRGIRRVRPRKRQKQSSGLFLVPRAGGGSATGRIPPPPPKPCRISSAGLSSFV